MIAHGEVAAGYVADLVVVRGDPLVDVSVLRKPVLVIKDGVMAVSRR